MLIKKIDPKMWAKLQKNYGKEILLRTMGERLFVPESVRLIPVQHFLSKEVLNFEGEMSILRIIQEVKAKKDKEIKIMGIEEARQIGNHLQILPESWKSESIIFPESFNPYPDSKTEYAFTGWNNNITRRYEKINYDNAYIINSSGEFVSYRMQTHSTSSISYDKLNETSFTKSEIDVLKIPVWITKKCP
jgi:hypothetical protein